LIEHNANHRMARVGPVVLRDTKLTDALVGAPVNLSEVASSNTNDGSETGCVGGFLFLSAGLKLDSN
jgi:hypothetical protein